MCKHGVHVFDEVLSGCGDYLHCDACELIVRIESVDETYVKR